MWTDSHCHLAAGPETDTVITDARARGVGRFLTIGTDLATSRTAIEVAGAHEGVWASAGLHPHDASYGASHGLQGIAELLGEPEVVAVGECGLDYHYDHSPRPVQREVFAAQVALAHEHDLALVIHTREAWDDTFAILASEAMPARTVFHCFTGGAAEADLALATGAVLSFSGIVTFKRGHEVRQAATWCPLDRLLVETDSPYLAPIPHRGKLNQPAWLPLVGAAVAEVKGVAPAVVEEASTATAAALFRLAPVDT